MVSGIYHTLFWAYLSQYLSDIVISVKCFFLISFKKMNVVINPTYPMLFPKDSDWKYKWLLPK